jgi:hypothetical protein
MLLILWVIFIIASRSVLAERKCSGSLWISKSSIAPCKSSDVIRTVRKRTRSECLRECVSVDACSMYRFIQRRNCILYSCVPTRRRGTSSYGFPLGCVDTTFSPTLMPTSVPSAAPTIAPSNRMNHSPSSAPTISPSESELDPNWTSPTGIKRSTPFRSNRFYSPRVEPCEYVRSRFGTRSFRFENWAGTQEECYKECDYDDGCSGAAYSDVLKECVKYSVMEITDDYYGSRDWLTYEWSAIAKKTSAIGYFSSLCSTYDVESSCKDDDRCSWNKGKRGYNQVRIIQSDWCGRTTCDASTMDSFSVS